MPTGPEIPNFGELLAPVIADLPNAELPALLAGLERSAADRYRLWAEQTDDPDVANGLLACAEREDEIARRVAALFPVESAAAARIDERLVKARETYLGVFAPHPAEDQQRIQADAERQGAAAWRSLADAHPDPEVARELRACAELEEQSADWLDAFLAR